MCLALTAQYAVALTDSGGGVHQVGHQVTCDGSNGCKEMELSPADASDPTALLSCLGYAGCFDSEFTDVGEVELFGECAGCYSLFNGVGTVFALGYRALNYANVDSVGVDSLTVQVYGHDAGRGAEVLCRAGSECLR